MQFKTALWSLLCKFFHQNLTTTIFSNILQYLVMYAKDNQPYDFLKENFSVWKEHLNEDGILQMLYIYSCGDPSLGKIRSDAWGYDLGKIVKTLKGNSLELSWFEDCFGDDHDAIVTYQKRR